MPIPPPSRRSIARAIVVVVLAAATGVYLLQQRAGPQVPAVLPERMDIVQTVVATGRIETDARVEIGASITGTVSEVRIRDGQRVTAGDVLFTLDDREARAAVAQAAAGLDQARARLEQVSAVTAQVSEQSVQQAAANLRLAELEMRRAQDLFAQGFISRARLDEATRTLDLAIAQHASSMAQAAAARPKGADYRVAATGLEAAQAALRVAQARLALTVVTAPADGTIVRRDIEPGNVATAGRVVIEMARAGRTQIVAQIDEKNLALLAVGQSALAVVDAFPGRSFGASIAYVNPGIDAQRGTVEVKLRVPEPPAFLLPDMTVSVEITVAEKSGALTIPATHVRDLATDPWILKAVAGRATRSQVKIGIRGARRVEILAGLEPGEPVLQPGVELAAGDAVRPLLASGGR